jgi:hypothetical protein
MISIVLYILIAVGGQSLQQVKHPDCAGVERWPTRMAYVHLKNDGLASPETIDFKKTATVRIASEQIGKDLFRQVHRVIFTKTTGGIIEVITVNDASSEECSMSGVEAYVVSKRLGR